MGEIVRERPLGTGEGAATGKGAEAGPFLKAREGMVGMGQPVLRRADRIRYEGNLRGAGRTLAGTFSGTSVPMKVDSRPVRVENRSNGPVAQADRAEVS